jgi:NADH-quinone oxidoreductase subunit L
MWVPLVALAGLATVGGLINLPFTHDTKLLERWLAPVVEASEVNFSIAGTTQTGLAILTAVLCAGAIILAARVYLQHKLEPVEPDLFAHAYHYDETVSAFVAGPGREAFEQTARFDSKIIDGAVNGVATVVGWIGAHVRRLQTGYVRNYALGIAVGAFILVGLFLTRVGS